MSVFRGLFHFFFFFKQKTAYEMRISDWSSDVCSSDLVGVDVYGGEDAERDDGHLHELADAEPENKERDQCERRDGALQLHEPVDDITKIGRASCRERVCQYV